MAFIRLIGFVALRALTIVACAVPLTIAAALISAPFNTSSSSDWGFGRLMRALLIGGGLGSAIGVVLAARLGRRWYDGPSRVLQTLAALAIPPLLMTGSWMERSHASSTPGLTILPEEGSLPPHIGDSDTPAAPQPPPAPTPARPTLPARLQHGAGR